MRNICVRARLCSDRTPRTCFCVECKTATASVRARTRAANAYTKRGIENSFPACLCKQGTNNVLNGVNYEKMYTRELELAQSLQEETSSSCLFCFLSCILHLAGWNFLLRPGCVGWDSVKDFEAPGRLRRLFFVYNSRRVVAIFQVYTSVIGIETVPTYESVWEKWSVNVDTVKVTLNLHCQKVSHIFCRWCKTGPRRSGKIPN